MGKFLLTFNLDHCGVVKLTQGLSYFSSESLARAGEDAVERCPQLYRPRRIFCEDTKFSHGGSRRAARPIPRQIDPNRPAPIVDVSLRREPGAHHEGNARRAGVDFFRHRSWPASDAVL